MQSSPTVSPEAMRLGVKSPLSFHLNEASRNVPLLARSLLSFDVRFLSSLWCGYRVLLSFWSLAEARSVTVAAFSWSSDCTILRAIVEPAPGTSSAVVLAAILKLALDFGTLCSWSSEGHIILSSSTDGPRISSFLQAINALSLRASVHNFVSELLLADMTRLDLLAANGTVNLFPLRLSPTGLDEAVSAVACGPLAVEEDDDARMGRPAQPFSVDR